MNSFYSIEELVEIGFKSFGDNVLISKKASIYSPEKMEIGNNVRIDDFCILSGSVKFGSHIHISAYTGLYAGDVGIELEDFSAISSRCAVYAISDDYSGEALTTPVIPDMYRNVIEEKIYMHKHTIVGAGSVLLPGCNLAEGTAIGAMSLVSFGTEPFSVYAGIPAKKIKPRSKKILELEKEYKENYFKDK